MSSDTIETRIEEARLAYADANNDHYPYVGSPLR